MSRLRIREQALNRWNVDARIEPRTAYAEGNGRYAAALATRIPTDAKRPDFTL